MGIGGVIGQDEAREWIGTSEVTGATSGCGAASPEAGDFNGVSTIRYARFRSFTGCFLVHPTRRLQPESLVRKPRRLRYEQDQIYYSHVIRLITSPPCLGFSS